MSLKGDAYETQEEISFRLLNSVVLYDGKPVYISRVNLPENADEKKEIARVHFFELPYGVEVDRYGDPIPGMKGKGKGVEQRKYLSSKNFELAPFKMGYCNMGDEAVFVSRNPVRQNRQGLSQGTTSILDINGKKSGNYGFNHLIAAKGFSDMVAGSYPTFKDVGDLLGDNEKSSVALSRSFACRIDNDLEALVLLHKGIKCGIALKGDKTLRLPPKFHFLKQEAEECRIPLA